MARRGALSGVLMQSGLADALMHEVPCMLGSSFSRTEGVELVDFPQESLLQGSSSSCFLRTAGSLSVLSPVTLACRFSRLPRTLEINVAATEQHHHGLRPPDQASHH